MYSVALEHTLNTRQRYDTYDDMLEAWDEFQNIDVVISSRILLQAKKGKKLSVSKGMEICSVYGWRRARLTQNLYVIPIVFHLVDCGWK